MKSLFARNLIFTILQPGLVAGLIPYLLVEGQIEIIQIQSLLEYMSILLFSLGVATVLYCIYDFAVKGKGTLSPADKTQNLVISGLYKYSRNPMYVGVLLILISESIFTKSLHLFTYTLIVFLCFHFYVKFFEEPRLVKDFKQDYINYKNSVNRWF